VQDEVGEEVERGGEMLVEDLDVEADGLLAGEGVEIAADGVDLAGELLAEREVVPLKTMCSTKCEMPFSACGSSREPESIQTPMETERT